MIRHEPDAQEASALDRSQRCVHAPQSVRVLSGISHPFDGTASQSPKPGLHELTWHEPPAQVSLACAKSHGWSQPPQ